MSYLGKGNSIDSKVICHQQGLKRNCNVSDWHHGWGRSKSMATRTWNTAWLRPRRSALGIQEVGVQSRKVVGWGTVNAEDVFFLLCRLVEEFRRTSAKKKPQKLFFFQDLCLSKKTTLGKKPKTTNNIGALSPFIFGISAPLGTRNRHHVPQK